MAETNPFDQFQNEAPGITPPPPETVVEPGTNPFDQFKTEQPSLGAPAQAQAPGVVNQAIRGARAVFASPIWQQKVLPTPSEVYDKIPPIGEAATNLYRDVYGNVIGGAEQKTSPHVGDYGEPVSRDLQVNDAGEVSYRDASGNYVPTDMSKQVVLDTPEGKAVFNRTEATNEPPAVGISRVLSTGLGANAPGGAATKVGSVAEIPAKTAPSTEATILGLRTAAQTGAYKNPEVLARSVSPQQVAESFRQIAPDLQRMDPKVAQRLVGELRGLGTGNITIQDLDHASTRLGDLIDKETRLTPNGLQTSSLGAAAKMVKDNVDKLMRSVAPEFQTADQNYATMKAAQTIVNRGDKAQILSKGGDLAGKMQTQATQLLANPQYMRGFKPDEVELIKQISEGRVPGDRLRQVGKWFLGKLGVIGTLGGGMVGYQHFDSLLGGLMGATASAGLEGAISGFLTKMGNRATADQVNALVSAIRSRSPLAEQLRQNLADWHAAWADVRSAPSFVKLNGLANSSRQLSNSLAAAGVRIHPAELMRAEGMSGGQAGENEQPVPRPPRQ